MSTATTDTARTNTALIQVLGAIAYGELKAYEGAKAEADAATDEVERRRLRKVAAEELRHHKGFVGRLEALGADPERAMRPYRAALDRYHAPRRTSTVEDAVTSFLGEGVADDLLQWLRTVVDADTAAFIDTVIADEVEHEAHAAQQLRETLASTPGGKAQAARAARRMVAHMLLSGTGSATPMFAFLRLGHAPTLLTVLAAGHARRMKAIGLGPLGLPVPIPLVG